MTERAGAIRAYGDSALLVELGEGIDPDTNARVHSLARVVDELRSTDSRWRRPIPSYASLLAPYDPVALRAEEAMAVLRSVLATLAAGVTADESHEAPVEIPVRYGGEEGPDLDWVAQHSGMSRERVIALHADRLYRVYMLGFAPGFAYLGPLASELVLPRRDTPRTRVPAGSVAIAGSQTAVYPLATPGGWHLIGRTDAVLWDVRRDHPALLRPGQLVRFLPRSDAG